MKDRKQRLLLKQVSDHLNWFSQSRMMANPSEGWVHTIRKALNMTLAQLAGRMQISVPTLKNFETREKAGTITMKSLREIAEALDMQLVYAIIPKAETLEEYVERRAEEKAREIVNRTDMTMSLEDQQNSGDRLKAAYQEKTSELKNELPKFLWD